MDFGVYIMLKRIVGLCICVLSCVGISSSLSGLIVPQHDPTPFILPQGHSLRMELDQIFSAPDVIKNETELQKAGFKLFLSRTRGNLKIAKHRAAPGYLFKLYLEDEAGSSMPLYQRRLVQRCKSASMIREHIRNAKFRYFTVPDKWLYKVPNTHLFVLVVQDMQLESEEKSRKAWKKKITPQHLQELFQLCNEGFTSVAVVQNIPYTKLGTFSCIDTEFPRRVLNLRRIRNYLSKDMRVVWYNILLQHNKYSKLPRSKIKKMKRRLKR
jgi:hypothetical protein